MSTNNIGLRTARGSGTSGHIQKSAASRKAPVGVYERRRNREERESRNRQIVESTNLSDRKVDEGVLKYEQKRYIEVKCYELRAKLEDEGVDDDDIEEQIKTLREKLKNVQNESFDLSTNRADINTMSLKKHEENRVLQVALQEFRSSNRGRNGPARSDTRWSRDKYEVKRERDTREDRLDRGWKRGDAPSDNLEASPSHRSYSKPDRSRRSPLEANVSQEQPTDAKRAETLSEDPRSKSLKSY